MKGTKLTLSNVLWETTQGTAQEMQITINHAHWPTEPAPLSKWKADQKAAIEYVTKYFQESIKAIATELFKPGTPVKWRHYGSSYRGVVANDGREVILTPISGEVGVRVQPYNPNGTLSPVVVTMPAENLEKLTPEEIAD